MKTLSQANGLSGELVGSAPIEQLIERRGRPSLDLALTRLGSFAYTRNLATGEEEYQRWFDLLGASVSRDSKAWYAEWDYSSGGICGALREYAKNTVRFGPNGPMKETSGATNQIRNPRCEGALAGTPGTAPTRWTITSGGATVTVTAPSYRDGWPYIQLRFSGTPTSTPAIFLEEIAAIAAVNGQTWTLAAGIEIVAGDLTNITDLKWNAVAYDSGGAVLADHRGTGFRPDARHRRYWSALTLANASTASVRPKLEITWDGSGSIDITLRIYAPQAEQAAAPSSPILPETRTPAASTRAAETFAGLVTVTRASRATDAGEWDFTNGGEFSGLREFRSGEARLTGRGLLVEESSTNAIRNPRGEGSPPTNWGFSGDASYVASGYENGCPYVDVDVTAIDTTSVITFEAVGHIAAASGQTWTVSAGFRLISGSMSGTDVNLSMGGRNASLTLVESPEASGGVHDAALVQGKAVRGFLTWTFAAAALASIEPRIVLRVNAAGDTFRLRIYAPQAEQKSRPTSPILPPVGQPGAATRASEIISIAAFPWVSNEPHTIHVTGRGGGGSLQYLLSLSDLANQDYLSAYAALDTLHVFVAENGSILENKAVASGLSTGQRFDLAFATALNDLAASVSGKAQTTDATWAIPTDAPTKLVLGGTPSGGSNFNGYIERLSFWPRRRTNAELETLVGN